MATKSQTIYLIVKITLDSEESDPHEVINDMEYSFDHEAILDSEIVETRLAPVSP